MDLAEARSVRVSNFVILLVSSVMLPYAAIFYAVGLEVLAAIVAPMAVVYTSLLWIIRVGRHRAAVYLYLTIFNVMTGVYVVSLGPRSGLDTVYFLNICFPFLMLPGAARLGRAYGSGLAFVCFIIARAVASPELTALAPQGQVVLGVVLPPTVLLIVALCVSFQVVVNDRQSEELLELNRAAQEANTAKNAFLANMSHELRTPLNSVIGFSTILAKNRRGNLESGQIEKIERISRNGLHLLSLINEVLDLSKIESGHLELVIEPIDVEKVVAESVGQLGSLAGSKGISLQVDTLERPVALETDAQRLSQILLNLLGNALKFTPSGGTVCIRAVQSDGRLRRIDVSDSGIGISADKLDQIFKEFRQADETTAREFGGTGLGLPIARKLAQLLGYRLEVSSVEGAGSTFSLLVSSEASVPAHRAPRPSEPAGAASSSLSLVAPGNPVLVIDDNPEAREILVNHLDELGLEARVASNGVDGLSLIRRLRPRLVTLDIMMPGIDGWEVIRRVRADPKLEETPIVVVSMTDGERMARRVGATDFFHKPLDADRFGTRVQQILGSRRTILVVDDNHAMRQIAGDAIAECGADVAYAENGAEALEVLEQVEPDLILLDLRMPVMDGFEFLRRLAQRPVPSPDVIVLTAAELDDAERDAVHEVALAILHKGEDLVAALSAFLTEA